MDDWEIDYVPAPPAPKMAVRVKLLTATAQEPTRSHEDDAGLDVRSDDYADIEPGERFLAPTGIAISLPRGYAAFIHPRSGLAVKHGITVLNSPGTVDSGYTGEVKVLLINHGTERWRMERGERIAQIVIQRVELPDVLLVEELEETKRGTRGFGSTG